jgi:murein DD-endopeptidase MepM/ murein hydrolase activator NlpD
LFFSDVWWSIGMAVRSVARWFLGTAIALAAVGLFGAWTVGKHDSGTHNSQAQSALAAVSGSYGWPVKPFDAIHPVRSNFGDPRTLFYGPPTAATLYEGNGSFTFHPGVDIVAPDGTSVYPVRSGVVTANRACKVFVDSGNGLVFQYWHIFPVVKVGQRVVAHTTILGHVRPGYGHVHFAEVRGGRAVNPLATGHLSPYDDRTTPRLGAIEFRRPGTSEELLPELVRGRVEIDVPAYDDPAPAGPGEWAIMPTVPALVTWRVQRARDGAVTIGERTAFDVRTFVPRSSEFWRFYARGTRQNMATFKGHRYWRQVGVFVLRLGVLDTRRLKDGIYAVVVNARDIRNNTVSSRGIFLIYNRPGWPPKTPQG